MTNGNDVIKYTEKNFIRLAKEYRQYVKDCAEDEQFNLEELQSFSEWCDDEFDRRNLK